MKFQKNWRSFLLEQRYPDLILEARVKDVKKKYPMLDEGGWINYARRQIEDVLGPRGASKYLLWFAREMKHNFKDDMEEPPWWPSRAAHDTDVFTVANEILDMVYQFEQNQQRMEEKDIYKYNGATLQSALDKLPPTQAQKRKKKKDRAMEGSEIVYDDDDVFAVRPLTRDASCFYGQNTRWCISATQSRNYFDQYVADGKGFVMFRFDNIEASSPLHKIAVVYDSDGEYEEFFDALDDEIEYGGFLGAVSLNHKRTGLNSFDQLDEFERTEIDDFARELLEAGFVNITNNPPDIVSGWEGRLNELEELYSDKIQNGYFSAEIDNYGEGAYVIMSGGFDVELDNDIFETGETALPDDYASIAMLSTRISDRIYEAGIFGIEEVDIQDYAGRTRFNFIVSTQEAEPTPDGYEYFLEKMAEIEEQHTALRRVIIKFLTDGKFIAANAFDSLSAGLDALQPTLKNLEIVDYSDSLGEEEIIFQSKENFPLTGLPPRMVYSIGVKHPAGYSSTHLQDRINSKLEDINREIQDYAAQQLDLPISDLPKKKIQDLSIPETLKVYIVDARHPTSQEWLQGLVRVSIENPEADQKEIDVIMNVVRFIDQNYDRVIQATIDASSEVGQEALQAKNSFVDDLPDSAKQLIATAQQAIKDPSFSGDSVTIKKTLDKLHRPEGDNSGFISISSMYWRAQQLDSVEDLLLRTRRKVLIPLWNLLQDGGVFPRGEENPYYAEEIESMYGSVTENTNIDQEISEYFGDSVQKAAKVDFFREIEQTISEEKGRSRQRGIYKFYCMLSYVLTTEQNRTRGLDDILADLRALENVTIVTVVVKNQKVSEGSYIAGISVKFIPSTPGTFRAPEDVKSRILRDIKKLQNVRSVFKVSAGIERLE